MPTTTASPATAPPVVTPAEIREALCVKLRKAMAESTAAQQAFAAPYSSHDALIAFYEARGRASGIGMSIEALDALVAPAEAPEDSEAPTLA
jgi:hypothetical protein